MKKILIIFLILISIAPAFAIEKNAKDDVIIFPDENIERKKDLIEGEKEVILEEPVILEKQEKTLEDKIEKEINPYSKEALKGIIEKEYDLNNSEGMFKRQLTAQFNKGIIKDIGLQGSFIFNLSETISEKESNFKYNTQLINVGLKGKFRSEKEGYNLLFDLTPDMHDDFFHKLVLDAWIETKRIPHNTLMFGTSRPNVGYEGGQCPYLVPFLARSQTARNFGNIRKTGIRIKGDYKYLDYDLGGYSSDTWYSEFFPGVETDLWVNFKPLAKVKEKYGNLNIGGGMQTGSRNSQDFFVTSAAIRYDYKRFWMLAEYQNADGSNGASGLTDKKRWGYNITLAYRITKKLEFLLRYDDFDPNKLIANNNIKEYTAGINYFILGQTMRVMLNYVFAQNQGGSDSHKIIVGTQFLL